MSSDLENPADVYRTQITGIAPSETGALRYWMETTDLAPDGVAFTGRVVRPRVGMALRSTGNRGGRRQSDCH